MPTFLTIQNDDFQRVVKEIKKVDRELVTIVNQSKYSQEYKMNKTLGCITEVSEHSKNCKPNRTMITEHGHKQLNTINMALQDMRSSHKSKREIEENITRYIETFQDIDDIDDDDQKYG